MSDFEEQMKRLSPEEQKLTRMLFEAAQALYREAEVQLLEGFMHTEGRPRDGFDAMVLVCAIACGNQALAIGKINRGSEVESKKRVLGTILTIGGAMGHGLFPVSPEFPFSAKEMVAATRPHIDAGADALSDAVAEAMKRLLPILIALALHFASVYPAEARAFARLFADDMTSRD